MDDHSRVTTPSDFERFSAQERTALLALALTRTQRWPDAEDLVQDVLESAWRSWDRISKVDDPRVWVRRMLLNRAVSVHRRRAAERRALGRTPKDDVVHLPDVTGELDRLLVEVRRLPKRQGQVVALLYVDGLDLPEIASVLGCGPETARTHLRRARATLARRLGLEVPNAEPG